MFFATVVHNYQIPAFNYIKQNLAAMLYTVIAVKK